MLQSLKIQNIALIPQVEIEFDNKFNVLSGETGAGKSIIIGSFNFILGEKLKTTVIRTGAPFAKVDAVFTAAGAELHSITKLCGIEFSDNTAILTRILKADGKSECRVNGDIVTAATLKDVATFLINIHGQHQHEVLLKPKNHINILDTFGGNKINIVKREYFEEYDKLQKLKNNLKTFGGNDTERTRMIDMYEYQIKEIEDAHLHDNEDEELQEFKQKMINFEKINNNLTSAIQGFNADEIGLNSIFKTIISSLSSVANLDTKIEHMLDTAKGMQYDLNDLNDSLQTYLDSLEYDEEKFKKVENRLDEIKILKRKYGSTIADIFSFLQEAKANLDFLSRSEADVEKTKKEINAQNEQVLLFANKLTQVRKDSATALEGELVVQLRDLGMQACQFKVQFTENETCTSSGRDEVEFLFSANAGEEVKPLANIISGGEMSRFMLALKTVTARIDNVATLVFDEIDTGISGTMGINIATKMAVLSKFHQVIAVTHLPQIAAMADSHFLIQKTVKDNKTTTNVHKLDRSGQISEVARMIGGAKLEESAMNHAEAMKKWSDDYKANAL